MAAEVNFTPLLLLIREVLFLYSEIILCLLSDALSHYCFSLFQIMDIFVCHFYQDATVHITNRT